MVEIDEAKLLRLFGEFLEQLLKDETLNRGDLLKIAKTLKLADKKYIGDPMPLRIKKRR